MANQYKNMRPIPTKHKITINSDKYYSKCCLTGMTNNSVKIDIHHAWDYQGKQINELWAYMPVWEKMHLPTGLPNSVHNSRETREYVQYLSLLRATEEDLKKYPRKDWKQIFNYLSKKYEQTREYSAF